MRWRSMKSAPRDGSWVMLWWAGGARWPCQWDGDHWREYSHSRRCVPRFIGRGEAEPERWMRIEEPR